MLRPDPQGDSLLNRATPLETGLRRVLFVCIENSNRSQVAEAFARIHGRGKIEAYSAGSRPSGRVNPKAIQSMAELGYDLKSHRSQSLEEIPPIEFDAVVTMGCGDSCPTVAAKRRQNWEVPDPKSAPLGEFRAVRRLIETKVKQLLAELQSPGRL